MKQTIDITRLPPLPGLDDVFFAPGAAFSPDNNILGLAVMGGAPSLRLYRRTDEGFIPLEFNEAVEPPPTMAESIAFSPDGTLMLQGSNAGLFVYERRPGDIFNPVTRPSLPAQAVPGIAFAPETNFAAIIMRGFMPPVKMFTQSGPALAESTPIDWPLAEGLSVTQVAFSPGGRILAAAHESREGAPYFSLYRHSESLDSWERLPDLPDTVVQMGMCFGAAFSEDIFVAAVLTSWVTREMKVLVYRYDENTLSFTQLADLPADSGVTMYGLKGIAFSPDGNILAVAHNCGTGLALYQRTGLETFHRLPNPEPLTEIMDEPGVYEPGQLIFSHDGSLLVVTHSIAPSYVTMYEIDYGDDGGDGNSNGSDNDNGNGNGGNTIPARPFSIRKLIIFEPDGTIREVIS